MALLCPNLGARWGWVVNAMLRPLYPREESRYPLYRRIGGPHGRSWWALAKRKSLSPAGDRTPDRPAHSESPSQPPISCYKDSSVTTSWKQFEVHFLVAWQSMTDGALRCLNILGGLIENLFTNGRNTFWVFLAIPNLLATSCIIVWDKINITK
jgi:hypothetical protein